MVVNLVLLSLIALLPFTTSLIGGYGDSNVALAVFGRSTSGRRRRLTR